MEENRKVFNLNIFSNTQKEKEEALIKQYLFFFVFGYPGRWKPQIFTG